MAAVFTVLLVLAVSVIIVRIASVGLTLTGISKDLADFQALSAFTRSGFTTDESEQIVKMRERLNQIFADQTGQPIKTIAKDTDRNFWMTPEEAKKYGLVGKIIQSHDEL